VPRAEGPALAELQQRFFELVTAREGVAKELELRGLSPETLAAIIAGDARATAVDRLDVYANMYFFRILDVLRSDYPKLLAVLGDGAFHNLATEYLQAHPSRHPSLRFVGASMASFVEGHALARPRPWLVELAALEWARVDVFDRADQAPLAREDLMAIEPEDFATLPLVAIAACDLVPAAWAVEDLWRTLEARSEPEGQAERAQGELANEDDHAGHAHGEDVSPEPALAGHAILVWRRGVVVSHRTVDARERRALEHLRAGTTFGALCTALVDEDSSDDAAAGYAARLLGQWLADELLARA
jgi:Putative DNA-binding domain